MQDQLKFKLSMTGISINSFSEFNTGLLICDLMVNKLPKTSTLCNLKNKMKKSEPRQKADDIININVLIKYLKSQNIWPQKFQTYSTFTFLESQDKMKQFIELILNYDKNDSLDESQVEIDNYQQDSFEIKKQDNNIYQKENFQHSDYDQQQDPKRDPRNQQLSKLNYINHDDKQNYEINDDYSLNIPRQSIAKSSTSIKIMKPKANFNNDSFFSHQQLPVNDPIEKIQKLSLPPRPNAPPLPRNSNKGDQSPSIIYKQFKQIEKSSKIMSQTTIPKSSIKLTNSRMMLDCSQIKAKTTSRSHIDKSQDQIQTIIPPFQQRQHFSKRKQLQKQIKQIEKSIGKQKRDIVSIRRSKSIDKKPINIVQISQNNKQQIVEWLISINLLNSLARNKKNSLPQICKKGVIFPQVLNQKKQRTDPQIRYEAKPTKSAQIHANYRRVFDHLSKLNNFSSDFLYSYESFVPEVSQNVFWAFMLQLMNYFKSSGKKKTHSISKMVQQQQTPLPVPIKTSRQQYQKIRFSLQNQPKQITHKRRQTTMQQWDDDYQQKSINHKIKQQNLGLSRIDTNNSFISASGYQQLRMKKSMKMDTPRRQNSLRKHSHSDSLDKHHQSRILLKNSKILSVEQILPQITPQMQSISINFLKTNYTGIDVQSLLNFKQMFQDPIRNGTLLMLIVCKYFNLKAQQFSIKPTSINDCRKNLSKSLNLIQQKLPTFPTNYSKSIEALLKGEKSIFYGIIYHLIQKPISRNDTNFQQSFTNVDQYKQTLTNWIKSLKSHFQAMKYKQIQSFDSIVEHMSTGLLLHDLASLATKRNLKLVYDKPTYQVQYRANIMKALEALVQKQIINKQYLWKTKKISMGDTKTVVTLLDIIRKKMSNFNWGKNNAIQFHQLIKTYCTK